MNKHKKNTIPTTKHLRRYVAGELSATEQHDVEKSALKNQQTDDTLEGLRAIRMAKVDEKAVLAELRQKVRQRVEKKERKWLPYYYASAAAVVLAVGLGWWVVKQEEDDTVISPSMTMEEAQPSPKLEEQHIAIVQKPLSKSSASKTARKPPRTKQATPELLGEPVTVVMTTEESIDPNTKSVESLSQVADSPQKMEEKAKSANSERMAARATPPSPAGNVLRSQQVFKNAQDSSILPMASASQQLLPNEAQNFINIRSSNALPITWENYENYIATAARTFITQNPQAPRGRVVLIFRKDATDRFVDFENKNKADMLLFNEAVRIVKSGEIWNVPLKGENTKTGKIRIVIRF